MVWMLQTPDISFFLVSSNLHNFLWIFRQCNCFLLNSSWFVRCWKRIKYKSGHGHGGPNSISILSSTSDSTWFYISWRWTVWIFHGLLVINVQKMYLEGFTVPARAVWYPCWNSSMSRNCKLSLMTQNERSVCSQKPCLKPSSVFFLSRSKLF